MVALLERQPGIGTRGQQLAARVLVLAGRVQRFLEFGLQIQRAGQQRERGFFRIALLQRLARFLFRTQAIAQLQINGTQQVARVGAARFRGHRVLQRDHRTALVAMLAESLCFRAQLRAGFAVAGRQHGRQQQRQQ
jgi:hypothetical protein